MSAKEGKKKVDLSYVLQQIDQEMKKNPEIKNSFASSVHSLKECEKQGDKDSESKIRTTIIYMKKHQQFAQLPEKLRKDLDTFDKLEADSKKPGKDGKGGGGGSSPAPSSPKHQCTENQAVNIGNAPGSPKHQCTENQAVNIGNAPGPTQSSKSPSLSKKGNAGPEMIQKHMSAASKQSQSPAPAESDETEKLRNEIQKLKADLKTAEGKVAKETHILKDRLQQIEDLEKDNEEKDKKIKYLDEEAKNLSQRFENENMTRVNIERELNARVQMLNNFEKQVNEFATERYKFQTEIKELKTALKNLNKEKAHNEHQSNQYIEQLQGIIKEEKRKADDAYKKLLEERDDLRDRFSKLAGKKLQEQNADIADLSDPNRAMKLSERFGQLYDDEWTNAFEYLTDKKGGLQLKDAINLLLRLLQECWTFCNNLLEMQMESLNNVFLHPDQNPDKYVHQGKKGVTDRPRVASKDTQALKDVRRRIGMSPSVIDEVKQALLTASKSWEKEKKGFDKKHIDACAPYLQKCAEICWLMALHDPALFMKMDVQQGEKLDPNIYSVYSVSGTSVDFLVWPPLYNGKEGGLLSKGVAEPQRIVGKKK